MISRLVVLFIVLNCSLSAQLKYVHQIVNYQGGTDGLVGATGMAISHDHKNIYVAAEYSMAAYSYKPDSNKLTFMNSFKDGKDGMNYLQGAECVLVSNDDRFVYLSAEYDHAITIFQRNTSSGQLTYFKTLVDEQNGIDGLRGVTSMKESADGHFLYTIAGNDAEISVFKRDSLSGDLTHLSSLSEWSPGGLARASSIELSKDNHFVYVCDPMESAISLFKRDNVSGLLTFIEKITNGENGISSIWGAHVLNISADDNMLYCLSSQNMTVFSRDSLSGKLTFVETYKDGVNAIEGLSGAYSMVLSEDNKHLYTVSAGDSALTTFSVNNNGTLHYESSINVFKKWIAPDGRSTTGLLLINKHLLFTAYWESAIRVYKENGNMPSYVSSSVNGDGATVKGLRGARTSCVSDDHKWLYVASYYDGVSLFQRNDTTGKLTFQSALQGTANGVYGAAVVATVPGTDLVIVGGYGLVSVLKKLPNNTLTLIQTTVPSGAGSFFLASAIQISKDKKYVYFGADNGSGIAVYSLDTLAGKLSEVQYVKTDYSVYQVNLSPDNALLYVSTSNSFRVFKRSAVTGMLTLSQELEPQQYNSDNIYGLVKFDRTPDGHFVYGLFSDSKILITYTTAGDSLKEYKALDLSFLNMTFSGVYVDPAGDFLFLTSSDSPSLVLLQKDIKTGELHYVKTFTEKGDNFQGLDNPYGISFDSKNVNFYITSPVESSVSAYSRLLYLGLDKEMCDGDTAIFSVGPAYSSVSWSVPAGSSLYATTSGIYSVNATDAYGQVYRDTVVVKVNPLPSVGIDQDTSICSYQTISLYANPGFSAYWWSNGGKTNKINVQTEGLYYLKVQDAKGCYNNDSVYLKVHPNPNFHITGPSKICEGETALLGSSVAFPKYEWSTGSTDSTIQVTLGNTYSLSVTDLYKCEYDTSMKVEVNWISQVNLAADKKIYRDEKITIKPINSGYFEEFKWMNNSAQDSITLDSTAFGSDSVLVVWVSAKNYSGCETVDTLILKMDSHYSGISEWATNVNIYPNPASALVYFDFGQNSSGVLRVSAMNGAVVLQQTFQNNDKMKLDLSALSEGVYLLFVETEAGRNVKKLVIQH